jgi:hypothetical protein
VEYYLTLNRETLLVTGSLRIKYDCIPCKQRGCLCPNSEFRQLEKHLAEQLQALEVLKGDAGLKKEIEFETKLRDLLAG